MRSLPGQLLAVVLVLVLCSMVYWGLMVKPRQEAFWKRLDAVKSVHRAVSKTEGRVQPIDPATAWELLKQIQTSKPYSPNHPETLHSWDLSFSTDQGEIDLTIRRTRDQGYLVGEFPTRRLEEIADAVLKDEQPRSGQ